VAVCLCRAAVAAVVLDGTSWYIGTNLYAALCVLCVYARVWLGCRHAAACGTARAFSENRSVTNETHALARGAPSRSKLDRLCRAIATPKV